MTCGIDYSMTCPALCLYTSAASQFWYANEAKDYSAPNLTHFPIDTTGTTSQRAARLARGVIAWLFLRCGTEPLTRVSIEDYAFSATGRVFHIGENTGILKYFLDENAIAYVPIAPSAIKKFATGKGNADKPKMVAAFLEAYPDAKRWIPAFFPRQTGNYAKSPLADLADAYWIARYSTEKLA